MSIGDIRAAELMYGRAIQSSTSPSTRTEYEAAQARLKRSMFAGGRATFDLGSWTLTSISPKAKLERLVSANVKFDQDYAALQTARVHDQVLESWKVCRDRLATGSRCPRDVTFVLNQKMVEHVELWTSLEIPIVSPLGAGLINRVVSAQLLDAENSFVCLITRRFPDPELLLEAQLKEEQVGSRLVVRHFMLFSLTLISAPS